MSALITDRKSMQGLQEGIMADPVRKKKKKKVSRRRPGLLSIIAALAMFACLVLFLLALVEIDLLPSHILLTGAVILAVALLIFVILWFRLPGRLLPGSSVLFWLSAWAAAFLWGQTT